jgi:hypothetical protein
MRLVTATTVAVEGGFVIALVVLGVSKLASLKRTPTGLEALNAKPKTMLAPSTPTSCQTIRHPIESVEDATED